MPLRKIIKFDRKTIVHRLMVLIIAGVLLNTAFTFFTTDTRLFFSLVHFSVVPFIIALLLCVVPWFMHSLRLCVWLRFINHPVPYTALLKIIIASELGAAISPTALGSGPVKAGLLVEKGVPLGKSVSLTLLHSIEDYSFFALAVPLGLSYSTIRFNIIDKIASKSMDITFWAVLIAFGVFLSVLLTRRLLGGNSRYKKIAPKITKIWKDFKGIYAFVGRRGKSRFLLNVFFAGIQWTAKLSILTALTASLGLKINVIQFFVLQWVVFIMTTFIPTPGAIGGAETSFLIVFSKVLPNEAIIMLMTGWRFLSFYFINLLAVFMLSVWEIRGRKRPAPDHE